MIGNGDYIPREAAIEAMYKDAEAHPGHTFWTTQYEALLNIAAADVRPVVMCWDCKHSDTFAPDCTDATFPLKCLSIRYGGVYPNWFCEHGEKREEEV